MRGVKQQEGSALPVFRIILAILAAVFVIIGAGTWYVGFHDRGMNLDLDADSAAETETQKLPAHHDSGTQVSSAIDLLFHDRGMNLDFDADSVAEVEMRMWRAYYGGGSQVSLGMDLLKLMREQFGLSYNTAIRVAQDVASATVAFRGTREQTEYEQKVLPDLVRGYTRLRDAVRGSWDPEEVARAELDWWVARRVAERSAPEVVGAAIAHEYTLVYGKDNEHVRRAGLLRAQAAHLRDMGGQGNTDWPAIGGMLHESYRELSQGIRQ